MHFKYLLGELFFRRVLRDSGKHVCSLYLTDLLGTVVDLTALSDNLLNARVFELLSYFLHQVKKVF